MLIPQLYLNNRTKEAIKVYAKAFNTAVDSIMYDPEQEPETVVIHAEMHILGQRVMLSDYGGQIVNPADAVLELVAAFEDEEALKQAYEIIKEGSTTITPLGPVFFSPCMVQFADAFGVRWCFMV
ncbi:VOC family protein [Paenibacillus ihuae]|uniref:VOC family protein n=1 Tax=Paenibacillus ihuae TaxID=1232431 RepID=UPI0006D577DD|nr:VOC family protein [Paenibacillus ihuae]